MAAVRETLCNLRPMEIPRPKFDGLQFVATRGRIGFYRTIKRDGEKYGFQLKNANNQGQKRPSLPDPKLWEKAAADATNRSVDESATKGGANGDSMSTILTQSAILCAANKHPKQQCSIPEESEEEASMASSVEPEPDYEINEDDAPSADHHQLLVDQRFHSTNADNTPSNIANGRMAMTLVGAPPVPPLPAEMPQSQNNHTEVPKMEQQKVSKHTNAADSAKPAKFWYRQDQQHNATMAPKAVAAATIGGLIETKL